MPRSDSGSSTPIDDVAPRPDRRERLVDAAELLFARRGFHAATVPDIATAAGVSVGLLYRYFPSKAALAVAIVEREREQTRAGIRALVGAVPDPWLALRYLVDAWVETALSDRGACALVAEIGAEATRDVDIGRVVRAADAEIGDLVTDLVSRAGLAPGGAGMATTIVSALDGFVARIAYDPAFDPHPAAATLIALLAASRPGATPS